MKKLLAAAALTFLNSMAQAAPPSAESIETLFKITRAETMMDSMMASMEPMLRQTLAQSLGDSRLNAKQKAIMDSMPNRMAALLRSELSWSKMRPLQVQLYQESFEQEEVDGLIAFYQSPAGQAALNKMPVVMQKSMQMSQAMLQDMMPRMMKMMDTLEEEIKAAK